MKIKLTAIITALLLMLSLAACGGGTSNAPASPSEAPSASPSPSETPSAQPSGGGALSVAFLKGPTGMGAAYLMEQNEKGELGDKYDITLESDPTVVTTALAAGKLDIAAVPTNAAAALYNKTNGKVRIAAINTLGVLYILEKGDTVHSVEDLMDKTIYATGQGSNPEYVLSHILAGNGLSAGDNVNVEYLASDELAARMAAGELDICMLPVPAATAVLMKNSEVRTALDLTDEWDAVSSDGSVLTQGCIAVSEGVTDEQISEFLTVYGESIAYMTDEKNIDDAAALAAKHGIAGSDAIAKAAMPDCGMTFITGADSMREYLAGYYYVLFKADPTSIGGSVPDDAFYWEK